MQGNLAIKIVKGIQIGKGKAKLLLFTDGIIYRFHEKLLQLINSFSKITGYKTNIQNKCPMN